MTKQQDAPEWAMRLGRNIQGGTLVEPLALVRYANDASIYQCPPRAVILPETAADLQAALDLARTEGVGVTARGGGSSTAGQALGDGIVVDFSKYMNRFLFYDEQTRTCAVEPGMTLSALNRRLAKEKVFFPVETGSAGAATIGGMLGNDSRGIRAIRHGPVSGNILAADAMLADGSSITFGEIAEHSPSEPLHLPEAMLGLLQFGEANEAEIKALWSPEMKNHGGYNLRPLLPGQSAQNLAPLLAGSEGTLALATRIELKLSQRPRNRALGLCTFKSLSAALDSIPRIVAMQPTAVELLDRATLDLMRLAGAPAGFDASIARIFQADSAAVLFVEFSEHNPVANTRQLKHLIEAAAGGNPRSAAVIEVIGVKAQAAIWLFRKRAVERAMAVRDGAQPVSIFEDCVVPVDQLAAFAGRLLQIAAEHGTSALVHGSAGTGCLTIRPVLDPGNAAGRALMRSLAEAMLPVLTAFGAKLTGGYGLGLARSEFLERLYGKDAVRLMAAVKNILDPQAILNPGKFFAPPRFDDESLFKRTAASAAGCNGLAICLETERSFMCPSYQVTRSEKDSPRGRVNSFTWAQAHPPGAQTQVLGSEAMAATMSLCVSCKACTSHCPNAPDVPAMKVQTLAAARELRKPSYAADLYAALPLWTERARRWRFALALRDLLPGLPRLSERLGFAADRAWPKWRGRHFHAPAYAENARQDGLKPVILLPDCLTQSFEPSALRAAADVLRACGYTPCLPDAEAGPPLCCGRTFYDSGLVREAEAQAQRLFNALTPAADRGVPIIGLDPSCILMLRNEFGALTKAQPHVALFEEFIMDQAASGGLSLPLKPVEASILVQPHCHQRAAHAETHSAAMLRLIPGANVIEVPPACCGLNGIFGYTTETFETSFAMAELALFPAIRKAGRDALVTAPGFSCRKQIRDGLGRPVSHPAHLMQLSLNAAASL